MIYHTSMGNNVLHIIALYVEPDFFFRLFLEYTLSSLSFSLSHHHQHHQINVNHTCYCFTTY